MSDPSAPDEQPPAYAPVLRPGAAADPAPAAPVAGPPPAPVPEPAPEGASASSASPASWRSWAIAGVACGLVVVAGILLTRDHGDSSTDGTLQASAVPDQLGGPDGQSFGVRGAQGEITDIDGSTLTLRSSLPGSSDTETVTVETDGDTAFTDLVDGKASDLSKGDNVVVRGVDDDDDADGRVTAASITDNGDEQVGGMVFGGPGGMREDGPPPKGMVLPEGAAPPDGSTRILARITAGEITEVDGDQITIRTPKGDEVVVTTTSDTEVKVLREIGLHDLERGDEVRVAGDRDGDVVTATSVRRGEDVGIFDGRPRRTTSDADASAS